VVVLTGKLPTFPATRNGEATMTRGQVRYWSICGIDQDPLSPLPATTINAITDDDVTIDNQRNYVIAYSRTADRPANATAANGVSWVDWGTQSSIGLMIRWVCIAPEWNFAWSPHENHLSWARSDWAGSKYDSTLLGVNWRNGFMQCYLPKVHYLTKAEFEALGSRLSAEKVPVWVDETYKIGPSEALLGKVTASSVFDNTPAAAVANLNDGNYNTAWASAFGQPNATVTVDLGKVKVISAIKLYWDLIFFAQNYTINISDDNVNWSTIIDVRNGNGQIDLHKNLQNIRARYVRISMTQSNSWFRLGEVEVYTNDCDCNAPTTAVTTPPRRERTLTAFPNPTADQLHCQMKDGQAAYFQIFDQQGRLIRHTTTADGAATFMLHDVPGGAYILRATDRTGWSQTRPIIRQ
jgi:F5/8 type C domain